MAGVKDLQARPRDPAAVERAVAQLDAALRQPASDEDEELPDLPDLPESGLDTVVEGRGRRG